MYVIQEVILLLDTGGGDLLVLPIGLDGCARGANADDGAPCDGPL